MLMDSLFNICFSRGDLRGSIVLVVLIVDVAGGLIDLRFFEDDSGCLFDLVGRSVLLERGEYDEILTLGDVL